MLSTANLMSLISKYGSQREERALPFGNTTKEMVKDILSDEATLPLAYYFLESRSDYQYEGMELIYPEEIE